MATSAARRGGVAGRGGGARPAGATAGFVTARAARAGVAARKAAAACPRCRSRSSAGGSWWTRRMVAAAPPPPSAAAAGAAALAGCFARRALRSWRVQSWLAHATGHGMRQPAYPQESIHSSRGDALPRAAYLVEKQRREARQPEGELHQQACERRGRLGAALGPRLALADGVRADGVEPHREHERHHEELPPRA